MIKQRELTATFTGERRAFGDPSKGEQRVIIGGVDLEDGSSMSIKGQADEGELCHGMIYRFFGRVKTHHKWGEQFEFESFVPEKPATQRAVVAYLKQCDGIGPAKAGKLWQKYKEKAVEELRERPREVGHEIGLSEELADDAAEFLRRSQIVEKTTIDLFGLLHGRGLHNFKKLFKNLLRDYGAAVVREIRRNPYLLMRYAGCGFLKADKLYLELGPLDPQNKSKHAARLKRQGLCAWHAIASDSRGDTWYPLAVIRESLNEKISGAQVQLERAIKFSVRSGLLAQRFDCGQMWFSEAGKAFSEGRVARFIAEAADETRVFGTRWPDVGMLGGKLTEHQMQNLSAAVKGVIGVLAGSPGTGKTFSTAAIVKLVMQAGFNVAACAPTGKAAVRLTESLQANGVSLRATTIHSLLVVQQSDGGDGWSFQHCESDPLKFDFVFVDESSMIDTGLASKLLSARARGSHMLFIGDPNQLAPVGHGAPLRDFITAGVPTGTLTEIMRNSGRIVRACAEIRDRRKFSAAERPDLDTGENLVLIPRQTPESQIDALETVMRQFQASPERKYDPIWDVQIIVAVNKKSPLGRKPLNEKLQNLLNSEGRSIPQNPFRVGDKIINTKNGWLPSLVADDPEANEKGQRYVANGEQAEVLDVEPARTIVRMTAPDRTLVIPRGQRSDDEIEAAGDEGTGTGCNWELGYAISCHRSQGSEWPVVIILADEYGGARLVQTRQWLYTSVSRGKKLCLVIGKQTTCDDMCRRDGLFSRKTFLVQRIKEAIDGLSAPQPDASAIERAEAQVERADIFNQLLEGVF